MLSYIISYGYTKIRVALPGMDLAHLLSTPPKRHGPTVDLHNLHPAMCNA